MRNTLQSSLAPIEKALYIKELKNTYNYRNVELASLEAVRSRMKIAYDTMVETENLIEDVSPDLNEEEKTGLKDYKKIYELSAI